MTGLGAGVFRGLGEGFAGNGIGAFGLHRFADAMGR
jgi:hypothetical protein